MKKNVFIATLAMAMLVCGASCSKKVNKTEMMVGADSDEHGCKASAGYVWSPLQNDCIRVWEEGIALTNVKDENATSDAYIIFSRDSAKIEAHMVENESPVALYREGTASHSWSSNSKFAGAYKVIHTDGKWELWQGREKLYKEAK